MSGAPPQMMPSSSPPNVDVTDLNSFLRISMPTLSIALDTLISLRSMPAFARLLRLVPDAAVNLFHKQRHELHLGRLVDLEVGQNAAQAR